MPYILGLDPSVKKAGYVVFDTEESDKVVKEKGLLKTSTGDGVLVERLLKQARQIQEVITKYNVKFVGMEAPFFGAGSTEILFALNQFIHRVFYDNDTYVVCFPPQQLKKLVFPNTSVAEIGKPNMIDRAKDMLNLHGHRLSEDVADAYWAGYFGKRFYKWFFEKTLNEIDLGEYEKGVFCGKKTYQRGPKKGVVEYKGIIYRENELFFDFKAIKRRTANATKEKNASKGKKRGK